MLDPVCKTNGVSVQQLITFVDGGCHLRAAFAQVCRDHAGRSDAWIYGHVHISDDRMIGDTRVAVLLLRDLISRGSPEGALAVLSASYCARRASIDGGELLALSRSAADSAIGI